MTIETQSRVEAARREKLTELRERGVEPYAYGYDRTHTAEQATAAFQPDAEAQVRVAGRIVSRRGHGKTRSSCSSLPWPAAWVRRP